MAWDMQDYPTSWKNLPELTRKKAIDIGNALLADGYPEDHAIPIATKQAEKWFAEASEQEKDAFSKKANPTKHDTHDVKEDAEKLLRAAVLVQYHEKQWAVRSEGAEKASNLYDTKEEAITRAQEIAENKGTPIKIYKMDGSLERTIQPD